MKHQSLFDADIWVTRTFTPPPRPTTPIVDRARTTGPRPKRVRKVAEKSDPFPICDPGYSPATRVIIRQVSRISGFSLAEIAGPRRFAGLVKARQVSAWLARNFTDRSLPAIASELGGRDHTTILHAIRAVDRSIADGRIEPAKHTVEGWTRALLAYYGVAA